VNNFCSRFAEKENTVPQRTYAEHALDTFARYVNEFNKRYLSQDSLPKGHVWKPYRFAVQDVILGLTVVRHSRYDNLLEVDVCLMADPPQFLEHSGARIMMTALLSEAFECGGSMEIRFRENVLHGKVPREIVWFANSLGIELKHAEKGHITPKESRELYLALTGFSAEAKYKVTQLAVEAKLSPERVCFMVHNKIWELAEMEAILLGATLPHRVLLGISPSELGVLYQHDLMYARNAVLGGYLDRKLKQRERQIAEGVIELEADENDVYIAFDPEHYAKVYTAQDDFELPNWQSRHKSIRASERFYVLVRARNSHDLMFSFQDDLVAATSLASKANGAKVFSLYPRDFYDLSSQWQAHIGQSLEKVGVNVMVCPESVSGLDNDADARLRKSKAIRR
jgi:hypothetical protein